jgi:hypothetical protein
MTIWSFLARGQLRGTNVKRTKRTSVLVVAATIAAGLIAISTKDAPADAAIVQNRMDCGIGGSQTFFGDLDAPATVARGDEFTVTFAAAGPGKADGAEIKNMKTTFTAPTGSSLVAGSAEVVAGTGSGTIGAASASISGSTVTLTVPGPIANGASFENPTMRFRLRATGVVGTVLSVRLRQNAAYTLTAAGSFGVTCDATTPLTALTTTTIQAAADTTTTTAGGTTTTVVGTTSTTLPQPVTTYETWTASGGCGTVQTTTAPANTQSVTVTAAGASGGRSGSQASSATVAGGAGSEAAATFPASGGDRFAAVIGCPGLNGGSFVNTATPGGFSKGGGAGRGFVVAGQPGASGGSGGGSSAACRGTACLADDFTSVPLVVAGSGGGGGVSNCAGTASGPGGAAGTGTITAVAAGSGPSGADGTSAKSAGGAGGVNSAGGSQHGATSNDGSGGGGVNVAGGGGGAGYIGGGAGVNTQTGCSGAGGGGGGSSWVADSGTETSFGTATSGPGVTLRFEIVTTPAPCPSDRVPFASAEALVDQQLQDFRGRGATAAEQDLWVGGINRCERSADALITSLLATSQTSDDARQVRLYLAYFKRPPDPSGFAYWQRQLDAGRGLINAARKFAESSEFERTYGSLSNGDFVDLVYLNVLDRLPDPTGRAFWLTRLDARTKNRGEVMINFSESSENVRKRTSAVQVFRMFRGMRQRFPSRNEFFALLDPITNQSATLDDAARSVRTSDAYASRVASEG